jgi:capsule polysaccharide export protein KpsE/RkpR
MVPDNSAPLIRNLFLVGMGVGLTGLATLTGFISNKVLEVDKQQTAQEVSVKQLDDIIIRIDRHLESIDSKSQDTAVQVQALKSEESNLTASIAANRAAIDQNRTDRIRDVGDLSHRLNEMERLFAPLRDGGGGSYNRR